MGRDNAVGVATCNGVDGQGIEFPLWARFSAPVQTGPEAHPASCTMIPGSLPRGKSGRGVALTIPSPRLKTDLFFPSWPLQGDLYLLSVVPRSRLERGNVSYCGLLVSAWLLLGITATTVCPLYLRTVRPREGKDTCVLSTRAITEGFWKCLLLMLGIEVTVFTGGYLHSQSNTQVLVCETILGLELDLRAVTGLLSHVSVFCTYNFRLNHNALL